MKIFQLPKIPFKYSYSVDLSGMIYPFKESQFIIECIISYDKNSDAELRDKGFLRNQYFIIDEELKPLMNFTSQ